MNRFLYFLKNMPGCDGAGLSVLGLANRFSGPGGAFRFAVTGWDEGPGGSGCVVHRGPTSAYDPDNQIWRDCGAYCIGMDVATPPGPDDLIRELSHAGYELALGDGRLWRIPRLKKFNAETLALESALPTRLGQVVIDGRPTIGPKVCAMYEPLDKLGSELFAAFCAKMPWPVEQLFATAALLIAQNYRIGAPEVEMLGLLDVELALAVLAVAIDVPEMDKCAAANAGTMLDEMIVAEESPDA